MNILKLSSIRLLLVDDDSIDRLACKQALNQHPDYVFEILEAETGQQGLDLALSEQPDCILLDYYLPDFNGVEFLAELADPTGELPVPVVMLTGANNAVVAVDALKRGARDYLVKDGDQESLQWLPAIILRALREQWAIREKTEAIKKMYEAEAKYRTLVEQIPAITYIASLETPSGKLHYISPQIKQLGFPTEEWLEDPHGLLKRVHIDDRQRVIEEFAKTYEHHTSLRCEYRMVTAEGRVRWFLDEANPVLDVTGRTLYLQGILVDITDDKVIEQELDYYRRRLEELVALRTAELEKQTNLLKSANANLDRELCERKRADAALRRSEARFRLLLESAGEGIYGLDAEGCCIFINQAALEMLGYKREELLGQDIHVKIHHSRSDGTPHPALECPIYDAYRKGARVRSNGTLWRKDGSSFQAEYSSHPIRNQGHITGAVIVFRDVTEVQALTQRLFYQASHDPLTDLINRVEFERDVERALTSARENELEHVVCYLDLDQFKEVNDTCGHAAGDQLLHSLGGLLLSLLSPCDTLARLGGDEFGLLLECCSLDRAGQIAEELCEAVRSFRFTWDDKTFSVGVSVGVAPLTAHTESVASVICAADAACYMAKKKGRNGVHVLEREGSEIIQELTRLETADFQYPGQIKPS
jgi:diguanylate cyclase (GGDEF)-like protein/PAS domain S-box-containing protein